MVQLSESNNASHQCGPGLIPRLGVIYRLSLLFRLSSLPREAFLSCEYSGLIPSSTKNFSKFTKFHFDLESVPIL